MKKKKKVESKAQGLDSLTNSPPPLISLVCGFVTSNKASICKH